MKTLSLPLMLCFILATAFVGTPEQTRKLHFNLDKNGLAIQGYDPVSYINSGKAVEGSNSYSYTYKTVTYHFVSATNKAAFVASPDKFEPAYGGWCAYAMGNTGEKVEIDPETFKVVNGKTYLFYNFYFNNTLEDWNKNESTLLTAANKNWDKITTKNN